MQTDQVFGVYVFLFYSYPSFSVHLLITVPVIGVS